MDHQMLVNGHRPSSESSTSASSASDPVSTASTTSTSASIHRHAPASSPSLTSNSISSSASAFGSSVGTGPADFSPSMRFSDASLEQHRQHQHRQQHPSKDNCDRIRSDEEINPRLVKMSSVLVGKTVSPFLKEHIPGLYAPIGKGRQLVGIPSNASSSAPTVRKRDPNSKFCYRHRPDSKCRRAADETKMGFIQSELNSLSTADQEAITHVWSLFSAAPSKHRELMLQGIITQCCFPQLSTVSREVQEQLKIDFLAALPNELSYKILCSLDTVSLCKAAQVSRRWRSLADDDVVWHRMCEQHIDRKCTKCGWGLPLLERKKLMAWNRHQQGHRNQPTGTVVEIDDEAADSESVLQKRHAHDDQDQDRPQKRQRVNGASSARQQLDQERKFRPWKDVYRDRFKVGYNWKTGRCSIKTFKGHENGVTCLQFDDNILATGSYDTTIKIWNIETGEVMRTLRGHTSAVRCLQFDDTKLISGSFDRTIKIWNWQTGECLSTLQCHTEGVLSVHFDGCTLASGSIDKTVKIFSFDTKQTFCLRGHTDWVNHVRIDSPSRVVFSASDDLSVKLWDLDSKQCIKTFLGHVGQVQQVLLMPADFEPDEVPSPHTDNSDTLSISSGRSASPVAPEQTVDNRAAYGPGFTSDSSRPLPPRYMLTGGLDNTVRLWDTATGKCIRSMFGHVEGIWGLVGDTLRVVTGANDSMTKIWEPRSGKCERSFTGHAGPVTCVGLSDSRMASGSEDGEVRLYSFEGERVEERGTPS
ncbi:putative E3 ubiquitin ligase complex SCF subunit scon-2 [Neonectria ditissima]|uniref:Putative E3 ubiquitin ligase complex SCF subunit scon-2 n=1 Tax=Neonectria ditissima TaxID=78410 RepID=A0A0P7B118_9HYPO|nr:putative E3 ubiquitin ligase complex SCF subunit scon-2 [Neonectria ditissima]